MNVMAKNGEVALRLQPGGGLYVPCYPAVYKSGRRRDRGQKLHEEMTKLGHETP
jgi:hypothetical protein